MDKIWAWCKHSGTVAWARLQYVLGLTGTGLIVAFSGYDFNQLATLDLKDAARILAVMSVAGIVTEVIRRRPGSTDPAV